MNKKSPARDVKTAKEKGRNVVAALDIGSSKICCFIAKLGSRGSVEVVGIGHQASRGVKSGAIVDLRATEIAVSHAVEAAEIMARDHLEGQPISGVFVNVPGTQVMAHQLSVDQRVAGHEVSDRDVRSALTHARSVAAVGRDELIHVIPADFALDRQRGIVEPRGMKGENLSVQINAITAYSTGLRNLSLVAEQNRLEVDGFCAAPYAAGLSCLVDDEKNLGCTVVDMGGGTTSVAVFMGGKLIYAAAVPVGGNHVTSDIAQGLATSLSDAERIKTLYGSAFAGGIDDGAMIDVPPIGEEEHAQANHVARSYLTRIIQPRIEETFELVRACLVDAGIHAKAGRRVVLTGGAAQLSGLGEIGQMILEKQIRVGRPYRIKGLAEATGGPSFSCAAGLLHYAAEHAQEIPPVARTSGFSLATPFPTEWMQKITYWLKENW